MWNKIFVGNIYVRSAFSYVRPVCMRTRTQLRENIACDPPLTIVICKRLRQHSKAKIAGHQLIHERRHRTECYTTMQIF